MYGFIVGLSILFYSSTCLSYANTTQFDYCNFVVKFWNQEIWVSPTLFFFFKIGLVILGPLHFHMNFRISLSISTKKGSWYFYRHCTESINQYGETDPSPLFLNTPPYKCQVLFSAEQKSYFCLEFSNSVYIIKQDTPEK